MRLISRALACTLVLVAFAVIPAAAEATFAGPNGKVAYYRSGDIWTVDPDGTDARNVTFSRGFYESFPAWSPDGRRLAFVRARHSPGDGDLMISSADGSEPRVLPVPSIGPSGGCTNRQFPAWSPDGQRIVFSCNAGSYTEIWSIQADGTALTRLTNTYPIGESRPAWSPDGTKIAYERDGEIWTMNPDGSGQAALVTSSPLSVHNSSPNWSPDGQKVLFSSTRECVGYCSNLWVIDRTGANLTRLTSGPEGEIDPAWSPDGQRIVFTRCGPSSEPDEDCQDGLYTMKADGTEAAVLVDSAEHEALPDWQPALPPGPPPPDDPAKIVFVSARAHYEGDARELYAMNSDGSALRRLTFNYNQDNDPAWSPDATRIAFSSNRDGNYEIYVMQADGSGQTRLTNSGLFDGSPTWSPDGTRIAYHRAGSTSSQLRVMDADGTDDVGITSGTVDWEPDWSPDGSRIAFHGVRDGAEGILVVNPDGSDLARITTGDDDLPAWSPSGARIAFNRLGSESEIWVANADGTGQANITPDPGVWGNHSSWSPDGKRIAFDGDRDIYVANADGTGRVNLTNDDFFDFPDTNPDFRGPTPGYPRPKGAAPMRVSLVTAYDRCTAPDRTHGPPLAFSSCAGPQMSSQHLTVGTGDSNGKPARNEGYLTLKVMPGNPSTPADEADVSLELFSDDVFTKSLADYSGELRTRIDLRITDRQNTPSPGGRNGGTVSDLPIGFTAACTPVSDPAEGSSCSVATTVDALAPGAVNETKRSIWAVEKAQVFDGGADGDADTVADDTLFATQGVFIP